MIVFAWHGRPAREVPRKMRVPPSTEKTKAIAFDSGSILSQPPGPARPAALDDLI